MRRGPCRTDSSEEVVMVRGHGGRLWPVLSDQRSRTLSGTALATGRVLTEPASQNILFWSASIGRPARSHLIKSATRRFHAIQYSKPLPGLTPGAAHQVGPLSSPGGLQCPFIRRRQGSARGDFPDENRRLTAHGCAASPCSFRVIITDAALLWDFAARRIAQ